LILFLSLKFDADTEMREVVYDSVNDELTMAQRAMVILWFGILICIVPWLVFFFLLWMLIRIWTFSCWMSGVSTERNQTSLSRIWGTLLALPATSGWWGRMLVLLLAHAIWIGIISRPSRLDPFHTRFASMHPLFGRRVPQVPVKKGDVLTQSLRLSSRLSFSFLSSWRRDNKFKKSQVISMPIFWRHRLAWEVFFTDGMCKYPPTLVNLWIT
jgi:hypothetical protein